MNDGIGEFGMLVADLHHRGKAIGSALVERAEHPARDVVCHTMRRELLTPHKGYIALMIISAFPLHRLPIAHYGTERSRSYSGLSVTSSP
jgi:hypothetical protein